VTTEDSTGVVPGALYVVATPIGNREDITLRALRVLREVSVVAAEDVRHTRMLLTHFGISTRLLSYREANKAVAIASVLTELERGAVALVSDAGMPAISDPGVDLVVAVLDAGRRVEVVPGANAALTALVSSGLPPTPFTFVGFLSRQRGDRLRALASLAIRSDTLVFYEAPHRLLQTLKDMRDTCGDRPAAACRELTKRYEEVRRGTLSTLYAHFVETAPRGEFCLVVGGALTQTPLAVDDATLDRWLREGMQADVDMRELVSTLAHDHNLQRRVVYARWQALRRDDD